MIGKISIGGIIGDFNSPLRIYRRALDIISEINNYLSLTIKKPGRATIVNYKGKAMKNFS
jgi:hypothetical protein